MNWFIQHVAVIQSESTFDKVPESVYHIWARNMFSKAAAGSGMH